MKSFLFPTLALGALTVATPASAQTDVAVLAGGCFWGMEAVFEHVRGVQDVVSGYAGGRASDATYDKVSSERTGHAEAVRITYDPSQISYGQLLQIYFTVAHDPTQLNRQGPDTGRSYRSAIFPQSPGQERAAAVFIQKLKQTGAYKRPIATRIESGRFFRAESEHQDFARRNPMHPYIVVHDRPKVASLRKRYPNLWKA
ncbi:peptide-methionine (S)-S-oxide reductase MsrA [Sphingomonas lutea]|uniref:Peptide methionine sulfoxide reductase MsrA n=1 Tax=Sphingomonas lutea TaxID=1045317 RepID=A0A7G9SK89_9SPHN|nr:peptide-methionine (S)-S-oxide reductase MsrA [Sphingomonas lutea]QNN68264.1 peptide-methionine (S)-S-oxide reductase MsrA [Sphingomonas lutea]